MSGEGRILRRPYCLKQSGLHCRLNELPEERVAKVIAESLETVGLKDKANQNVSTFSKGMKQRLAIADILVKTPKLAFLDEPTSGIDPEA